MRASDRYNVLDYGADKSGVADFSAGFQALATSIAGSPSTIYFPAGSYKFNSAVYVSDNTNIITDSGTRFINSAPNTVADGTVLNAGQSSSSVQRVSSGLTNTYTAYISQVVACSGTVTIMGVCVSGTTPGGYEKAAIYADAINHDASAYTTGAAYDTMITTKDAVGADLRGLIASGNMIGRTWGAVVGATAGVGSDGLVTGLEVDISASDPSSAQNQYNRFNSKYGIGIVSQGSEPATTGLMIAKSGAGGFFDGVTVAKDGISRNAFQILDLSSFPATTPFSVDSNGNTFVRSVVMASYAYTGLPLTGVTGRQVLCSDCLKPGETTGTGTGMLVFDDGHSHWLSTAGTVAAH